MHLEKIILFLIFNFVLFFDQIEITNGQKVVIIGSGISGLGAANHFNNKGFKDYIILEVILIYLKFNSLI